MTALTNMARYHTFARLRFAKVILVGALFCFHSVTSIAGREGETQIQPTLAHPAPQGKCKTVFPTEHPAVLTLKKTMRGMGLKFHTIPDVWLVRLMEAQKKAIGAFNEPIHVNSRPGDSYAAHFFDRYQRGDEAPQSALQIGYIKQKSIYNRDVILPDSNPLVLPATYTNWLLQEITSGHTFQRTPYPQIARGALFPGFSLRRISVPDNENSDDPEDYHFVRAFLDPWPDPEIFDFTPNDVAQLPNNVYYKATLEGSYPFTPSKFQRHEIGHFSEFRNNPEMMLAVFDSVTLASSEASQIRRPLSGEWAVYTPRFYRGFVTSELLFLPNTQRTPELQALLKPFGFNSEVQDIRQILSVLRAMPFERKRLTYKNILQSLEKDEGLFVRVGGAARDASSMLRTMRASIDGTSLRDLALELQPQTLQAQHQQDMAVSILERIYRHTDSQIWYETPYYVSAQARKLYDILFNGLSLRSLAVKEIIDFMGTPITNEMLAEMDQTRLFGMSKAQVLTAVDEVLTFKIAYLLATISAGIAERVQPEVIFREANGHYISRGSSTFHYFRAFALPGSTYYRLFVQDTE